MIDVTNLTFGNTPTSFWGQFGYNEQITIYTSEYIELENKFISIGEDIETKYFAISLQLNNFNFGKDGRQDTYLGKIILVNLQRFLDNQFNDGNEAPIINIANGKLNEKITVPTFAEQNKREPYDPSITIVEEKEITIPKATTVEVFFPSPTVLIGGGIDLISNTRRDTDASPRYDRKIVIKKAGTEPKHYPINPYYCILPTQWKIPSIDNYG